MQNSKLNILLIVVFIILVGVAIWKLSEKKEGEENAPNGQTQINTNPNGPDYHPNQDFSSSTELKTYTDSVNGWQMQYRSPVIIQPALTALEVTYLGKDNEACSRTGGTVDIQSFPKTSTLKEWAQRQIEAQGNNITILENKSIPAIQGRDAYELKIQIGSNRITNQTIIRNEDTVIILIQSSDVGYGTCSAISNTFTTFKFIK